MSEQLPNEEMDQQFNNLPLPDEEASWQKMKELLDRDDDDGRIVPPVFLRSCLGWGIFLLVGLTVTWFIIHPEKWWSETTGTKQNSLPEKTEEQLTDDNTGKKKHTTSKQNIDKRSEVGNATITVKPQNEIGEKNIVALPNRNENSSKIKLPAITESKKKFSTKVIREKDQGNQTQNQNHILINDKDVQKDTTKKDHKDIAPIRENNQEKDTVAAVAHQTPTLKDTAKKDNPEQPQDSIIQKKTNNQKKFFLAAGIGEQQQIPVAGQTAVPYSSYGRKGSLSDYVPSVYIQLQKEKKWFAQAEFRYGAAQSVKELSYNRKTDYDTSTMNVSITTMRLKKTYYHQLPLTFNYYLQPNFSIGVGGSIVVFTEL